jgi:hypothetical protein
MQHYTTISKGLYMNHKRRVAEEGRLVERIELECEQIVEEKRPADIKQCDD